MFGTHSDNENVDQVKLKKKKNSTWYVALQNHVEYKNIISYFASNYSVRYLKSNLSFMLKNIYIIILRQNILVQTELTYKNLFNLE